MIELILLLEVFLSFAAILTFFVGFETNPKQKFVLWLVSILIFFIAIKVVVLLLVLIEKSFVYELSSVLDAGFATAFTTFIFLRCRELKVV